MSIYLHRPSVTDPSVAPTGDDCFYALSPVPNLKTATPIDWFKEIDIYKDKMRMVLEKTIPGFSDDIVSEHILTPKDFEERYLSPFGLVFRLSPGFFNPHGSGRIILVKKLKTSILLVQEPIRAQVFLVL